MKEIVLKDNPSNRRIFVDEEKPDTIGVIASEKNFTTVDCGLCEDKGGRLPE